MSDADASWDWPGCEGKPIVVEVYAPEGEVELFVSGKSVGRQKTEKCRALFETTYEPGEIRAAAHGLETALSTPAGETTLTLSCDPLGEELVWLTAELRGENGALVTSADELLTAEVEGAELLGFGSGDPKPMLNYNEGKAKAYKCRAQLVLKKRGAKAIRVSLRSETGKTAQISL